MRRSRKLIQPRIQLRLIGVFLGGALLTALLVTLIVGRELVAFGEHLPNDGSALAEASLGIMARGLGLTFLLALPVVAVVGLLVTFRIAGPLYRFERYLEDVIAGRETGPCHLRKGDELQELCRLITEATEGTRAANRQPAVADQERRAA